jgi:flagellar biosynthesis chaperone FliJ
MKADSSFKSFLRLKEKKREEHMGIESKKEETEMDDLIGARFIYNQSNF